jgi:Pvc16 N-terminal domain
MRCPLGYRREKSRAALCACKDPGVADYGVIADVSATLQKVLTDAYVALDPASPPVAEISELSGTPSLSPARVTLFLFETVEDPSLKNRPRSRPVPPPPPPVPPPNTVYLRKPPLALLLRYLLTPWSSDPLTDHRLVGRTMQVLYDGAILSGPQLQGGLAGTAVALKVTLSPLTLEERARIWYAIEQPYRLSITYEVRVVNLDAITTETIAPVSQRSVQYLGPGAAR